MKCFGVFCGLVPGVGVGRVLVQRLGWTVGFGEGRAGEHEQEQRRGKNPLHAKNVALTTGQGVGYQSTGTKGGNRIPSAPPEKRYKYGPLPLIVRQRPVAGSVELLDRHGDGLG